MRIHILGGPGSGKSFSGRKLADSLGIPHYDLDDIFWDQDSLKYGVRAPSEVRDQRLSEITTQDSWVIEGVFFEWLRPSFERADRILVLTPCVYLRHLRVTIRFIKRKLRLVECKYKDDLYRLACLLIWNHRYDKRYLPKALDAMREFRSKVVILRNGDEVWKHLEGL